MSKDELLVELEALLDERAAQRTRDGDALSQAQLLHELQVHQVELEMQNRELRESQQLVEASRSRYADLYDFAPIAYFTFDAKGHVTDVNLRGASMLGIERGVVIDKPFVPLAFSAGGASFFSLLDKCFKSRSRVEGELELSPRKAPSKVVHVDAEPVLDLAGRVVACRMALTDITHLKQIEADLARSFSTESRLRKRLDAIAHVLAAVSKTLVSSAPDLEKALQAVVDEARDLVGAEYAALSIGGDDTHEVDTWVFSGISEAVAHAIGRRPRRVGIFKLPSTGIVRLRDLREHPMFRGFPTNHPPMTSFIGTPIVYNAHFAGTLYLTNKIGADEFDDEDERTVAMLADRVAIMLEVARLRDVENQCDREREAWLSVVAHDLRQPAAVIAFSAQLLDRFGDGIGARERRSIARIQSAAKLLDRMIDDLLEVMRIDTQQLRIERMSIDMVSLVRDVVDRAQLNDHSIRVETPNEAAFVLGDRDRLGQVLTNLVSNAVRYSYPQSEILVRAAQADGKIEVSVANHGKGIAPEELGSLFNRFYRTKSAQATLTVGLGLGLYIAKSLVEAHGGRITAESIPDGVTTFRIVLPVAEAS